MSLSVLLLFITSDIHFDSFASKFELWGLSRFDSMISFDRIDQMRRLTLLQLPFAISMQVLEWWAHQGPPWCSLAPSALQVSFDQLLTCCGPIPHANPSVSSALGCIPSTVTWLRLYVLTIVSLQLSPLNLFDFSLFNCGGTVSLGLFVLAVAGLRLGILDSSPGRLTLGTSPGALRSSVWSRLTD